MELHYQAARAGMVELELILGRRLSCEAASGCRDERARSVFLGRRIFNKKVAIDKS